MTAQNGTFSTSDNCTISYTLQGARQGSGPRPRLALIHSLALDRSVWDGVVERLGTKAEILTYDARGHGRSARPHMEYTAELFARDLAELMDHVGWDSASVAGCSMGGCVAQAFAGLYPSRTEALALIDTTAWYGADAPTQFRDRAAAAKAKGMRGLIDFQVTRWFSDNFVSANPGRVKKTTDVFLANDFECYASTCALLGDADLQHYLGFFKMPVAVIVGDEDYATPIAMAGALHEAIPQSTFRIIEGGRHLTPIECPEQIAGEIANLLERG
jgi:3-oxoadipate enol-lactonase